jgi:predicted glycosyltransferase involved in capsule biosynthesis
MVGGFDERFRGWGWEDRAFFIACDTLCGHDRISGPVRHLWHPRSPEKNPDSSEYQAGRALCRRYKRAHRDRQAIQGLLNERVAV